MTIEREERPQLLHLLLDLGESMLRSGAEIQRIEDTMMRLGSADGAQQTNVFAITSSIILTVTFPDGEVRTQTRRIRGAGATDFTRLEEMNRLSRRVCARPIPLKALGRAIHTRTLPEHPATLYAGSVLAAMGFAVFFGGTLWDGLMAALFALVICLLKRCLAPLCPNNVVFYFFCSLLVGGGICAAVRLSPVFHLDKVMIGDIMLLIPGLALTNSIRDIFVGDTISGIMRLTESLLWAGALASGFMIAIMLLGGG